MFLRHNFLSTGDTMCLLLVPYISLYELKMLIDMPESFLHYVKYAQFVAQLGFFSTSFFCFILVFLTMFGVKRNFGTYKYLLVLFPIVGIFFATIELVLYPVSNYQIYNVT